MSEQAFLEQLRLQDGKLFQNERLVALYLDVKTVLLESERTDQDLESILQKVGILAPQGSQDYHANSLYECVKMCALLLWPGDMLLVARPKLSSLLLGMQKRLKSYASRSDWDTLDPIKRDFVFREIFRRSLINDCLTVFDAPDATECVETAVMIEQKKPAGAHSTLGPISDTEEAESSVGPKEEPSQVQENVLDDSVLESVLESERLEKESEKLRKELDLQSTVSKRSSLLDESKFKFDDSKSSASASTSFTSTSIMRRPLNVRKVKIENEL